MGGERLWLERPEIEAIIEGELRNAGLLPDPQSPIVDVERFIEAYLRVCLDQHADLAPEVLGCTEFRRGEPPRILINQDLTGSAMDADRAPPGIEGRWRATLAHEATHVVLHRSLFEPNADQGVLFEEVRDTESGEQMVRCLKREVSFHSEVPDWREVQANRGMAALLMPRSVFVGLAQEQAARAGLRPAGLAPGSRGAQQLAGRMARMVAVSRGAAAIRLETLGLIAVPGASELALR